VAAVVGSGAGVSAEHPGRATKRARAAEKMPEIGLLISFDLSGMFPDL